MSPATSSSQDDRQKGARDRMVKRQLQRRGISDERVLAAMRNVPRHEFVPRRSRHMAYEDSPIPIGAGQTISQPYIVALMTQMLEPEPGDRILEIGVGSGYQTAILAEIVEAVIGIERIATLAEQAQERLDTLGYDNVKVIVGDGTLGYEEKAPYDGILVAAAGPRIPQPLVDQLAVGGQLVIPVGGDYQQMIKVVRRTAEGVITEDTTPVRFVPLIGEEGFDEKQ